jgi:hypothetical protein
MVTYRALRAGEGAGARRLPASGAEGPSVSEIC